MLRHIRDFLGFGPVVRPEVKPTRPPSARLKPPTRPEVKPVRPAIEPARPEIPAPARPPFVMPPTFPVAVATVIRGFGRHTERPAALKIKAAEEVLGRDRASYLRALDMIDGQIVKYVLPEHRMGDPDAEVGLRRRLDHDTYTDLPTWREAERADARNRRHLEWAGKPVPPPLHVPEAVQIALVKALNAAAAAVRKGGRDGSSSSGGPAPAPPETPAVADVAIPDDTGGRSKVAGKKKKPDEPEDGSGAPAAPETPEETPESDGDQTPPKP